jgi:hypothetical protein
VKRRERSWKKSKAKRPEKKCSERGAKLNSSYEYLEMRMETDYLTTKGFSK